jgi:hypothetical protein
MEWDNIETSESNKASSLPIGWSLGRRQRKMTTGNSRTQISEPSKQCREKEHFKRQVSVRENL